MSLFQYLRREDAILFFVLGFACARAYAGARKTLCDFREATRITTEEKQQDIIGQHTEDAISVDTLGELYNSPNWDIRQASVRILVERAVRGPNLDHLLRNAASKNVQTREEAMTTLAYLAMSSSRSAIRIPKIYRIVVDALVAFLPEAAQRPHEPHTDWKFRSKTEQSALTVLKHILCMSPNGGIKQWLDDGLITRWLGQYPFGGSRAKELKGEALLEMRNDLIDNIRTGRTDDRDLEFILNELIVVTAARIQLRRYKLVGAYRGKEDSWSIEPPSEFLSMRSYTEPTVMRRNTSGDDDNAEEAQAARRRRRRRREAVVIGDAGQPLSQDNIFISDTEPEEYEGFERVE